MPNTREKMIELAEVIDSYFGCDAAYFDVDKFTLAKRIMEAGWTKQEWISVKDMLPVDWCPVLVMVREIEKPLLGSYRENVWFHERWNTTFINGAVTHWMPLPQPPKGE